jgi:hypothetical protein
LLLGDEATGARLAMLRSADEVRVALITLLLALSLLAVGWMYTGLGLFAWYRGHPRDVRSKWVTNVEPANRLTRTRPDSQQPELDAHGQPIPSLINESWRMDPTSGESILPWDEAEITPETIDTLVREGRILGISDSQLVLTDDGRLDPTKLATYSLEQPGRASEMLLHRRATEELWPYFLATQAPIGVKGLLLGGLLAAALAALDVAGLAALPGLQRWLPARTPGAERALATLASLAVTLLAMLWVFVVAFPATVLLGVVAIALCPIAALVMLGLTSRRANSGVALATLCAGVIAAMAMSWGLSTDRYFRIHPMWSATASLALTFLLGHLIALIFGESRRRGQLTGLILGTAPIGTLHEESQQPIAVGE